MEQESLVDRKANVLQRVKDMIHTPTFCGKIHFDPITMENAFEYYCGSFMRIWSPNTPGEKFKLCFHSGEEVVYLKRDNDDPVVEADIVLYHLYDKSKQLVIVSTLVFIVQELQALTMTTEAPAYIQWEARHPVKEIGLLSSEASAEDRSEQRRILFLLHTELRDVPVVVENCRYTYYVNNMQMKLCPVLDIVIDNVVSGKSKYVSIHFPFTSSKIVVVRQVVGEFAVDSEWIYLVDPLQKRSFFYLHALLKFFGK